jgi:UV excision repair protein RAD23
MVTAEKKPKPAAAPVAAPVVTNPVVPPPVVSSTPTVAPTTTPAVVPPVVPSPVVNEHAIESLKSMGFPDAEVRAALTAARGNADLAYEFLCTGIPPQMQQQQQQPQVTPSGGAGDLEQLRQHPQFNQLKQLVQTNPAALPQVLNLLGQQSPALLTAINANEESFIAMMNEPITDTPPPVPQAQQPVPGQGLPGQGGVNPQQMMSMLANMPPEQRTQMAQSMGLTPEQLQNVMQMVSMMPPDQLQQMMAQGGMPGMGGGEGGQGGVPPGAHVIRLTEEELASVNRLVALGFTQQQAAEAFMVTDRNEQLAANYLFDSMGQDDGFEGGMYGGGDDFGGEGDGGNGDDEDDMYN